MKQNGEKYPKFKIKSPGRTLGEHAKQKPLIENNTRALSLGLSWGPLESGDLSLVCLYNLCQRSRHSLKTLGKQLEDQ